MPPSESTNWKEIGLVLLAGAAGGLFAYFLGISTGGANSHVVTSLLAAIMGGALAAGVGVYVIAPTDTSKLARCLFFAVLCGISWEPVLKAGGSLVSSANLKGSIAATGAAAKGLGSTPSPDQVKQVTDNAVAVLDQLPSVQNAALKIEAKTSTSDALKQLSAVAPKAPEAVAAIATIGQAAANSGDEHLRKQAFDALIDVSKENSAPAAVRAHADSAAAALGN